MGTNLKIQEEIQRAIALFQEEFGAELEEQLGNIESFQYESEASEQEEAENEDQFEFIEMVPMGAGSSDPLHQPLSSDQFTGFQRQNTRNDAFSPSAVITPQNSSNRQFVNPFPGVDFRIKFTDAHSNPADSPKPGDVDGVPIEVPIESNALTESADTNRTQKAMEKHIASTETVDDHGHGNDHDHDDNEEAQPQKVEEEDTGNEVVHPPLASNVNEQRNNEQDDGQGAEDDDDALPSVFETPRGPEDEYPTPGGPDLYEMDEAENIITRQRVQEMEYKVNSLSQKMGGLMERIEDLMDKNQRLELSKLELIANTADAMNEYRETVRSLNLQNQRLAERLVLHHRNRIST